MRPNRVIIENFDNSAYNWRENLTFLKLLISLGFSDEAKVLGILGVLNVFRSTLKNDGLDVNFEDFKKASEINAGFSAIFGLHANVN